MLCRFGIVFTAAFLSSLPVFAGPADDCNAYATRALQQNQVNLDNHCGLLGPAWSSDFAGHRNWCLLPGTQAADLVRETDNRATSVAECTLNRDKTCKVFATNAVARTKENVDRGCGLSGPLYHQDYQKHYDWCFFARPAEAGKANQTTLKAIEECRTAPPAPTHPYDAVCGVYVAAAEPQINQYNSICRILPEWSFDWGSDVSLREECRQQSNGSADWVNARVRGRQKILDDCAAGRVTYRDPSGPGNFRLDGCTEKEGFFCGDIAAETFCRWKGHTELVSAPTGEADVTVYLDCLMKGIEPASDPDKCICFGTCGYFKEITCNGKK